ncbi:MAG: hypothetical protein PVG03_06540 [Desulfarculaceae bacterium]|jgi:hypothetical protein
MKTIQIDDEVWAFLSSQAVPFVEKEPNQTLRRLLGLDSPKDITSSKNLTTVPIRRKQQRTNLLLMTKSGQLEQGQKVFLCDYRNNVLRKYQATIFGQRLKFEGRLYSMSELARILLKKEGYASNSVRGPAHWCTEDGVSIRQLWDQYLNKTEK